MSNPIKEYKLVRGGIDFEKRVNEHIKQGWQPIGGVVTCDERHFYQSMVRHEAYDTNIDPFTENF